jgi:catechol 2,3-dioxygenase
MAFFSIVDNHHDVALVETKADAPAPPKEAPGLAHVALKIGDSLDDLREAKRWLDRNGIEIDHTSDHIVSKSIYFHDPDGNQLEVFVDSDPALWRDDPTLVATAGPLEL